MSPFVFLPISKANVIFTISHGMNGSTHIASAETIDVSVITEYHRHPQI